MGWSEPFLTMSPDTWHMTRDTWHVTHDTWHVTHGVGWTFSPNFSSLYRFGIYGVLKIWRKRMNESVNQLMTRLFVYTGTNSYKPILILVFFYAFIHFVIWPFLLSPFQLRSWVMCVPIFHVYVYIFNWGINHFKWRW